MLEHANLVVTAWDEALLVDIAARHGAGQRRPLA